MFIEAQPRWDANDSEYAKQYFMDQRDKGIPHNEIYESLAKILGRSFRGVKQFVEKLYKADEDLKSYKYESWNREKIIDRLIELYQSGAPMNRRGLPRKLEFQIENHSLPKAKTRGFDIFFKSFDDAAAEAILTVGVNRETGDPITTLEEAKQYYRRGMKRGHAWTKEEILALFQEVNEKGYPVTISFFAKHPDLYKPLLGVNRSLEGLKWSVLRYFGSWGEAVVAAKIIADKFYDEEGKAIGSTEEIRVGRFLELQGIPYRKCTAADKIPVTDNELIEKGYKNFIPDFYILDESGKEIALVEVFGEIADSMAGDGTVGELYREKREAKIKLFSAMPMDFININNNSDSSDLSEQSLLEKFSKYISKEELSLAASLGKLMMRIAIRREVLITN